MLKGDKMKLTVNLARAVCGWIHFTHFLECESLHGKYKITLSSVAHKATADLDADDDPAGPPRKFSRVRQPKKKTNNSAARE